MRGECAVLYRALPFSVTDIDEWELWQIAVKLGEDEMAEWTGATMLPLPPAEGDAAAAGPVLRAFD